MTDAIIIEALLRTTRMVAVSAGCLVFLDQFRNQDVPPHNRRANSLGWATIALGAVVAGIIALTDTYGAREPLVDITVSRAILWTCLATGLTMRSAMRAQRKYLVWTSATLLGVTGFAASVADALL